MTVVVTNDVSPRTRGFLASCMLEIAPGVYTAPRMSKAVRDRVWAVVIRWHALEKRGSALMTWPDQTRPGGQVVASVGIPQKFLVDHDGIVLAGKALIVE